MTLDPISIASGGYVCGSGPDGISIASDGYICPGIIGRIGGASRRVFLSFIHGIGYMRREA